MRPSHSSPAKLTLTHRPHADGASDFVTLPQVLHTLRAHLLTLLGLPLACGLLGLYWALAQPPEYRASTLVQLDPKPTQPLGASAELYDPGYETTGYYHTQLRIINSRKLAEQLVARLQLESVREFAGSPVQRPSRLETLMGWLPGTPPPPEPVRLEPEEIRERAIGRVMRSSNASLAHNTTLIEIFFVSRDPDLAARGANALADIYIEELLQARLDVYAKATQWITNKLSDVSGELSAAETNLQGFRESREIVNVGGNRGLLEEELREATRRLREAQRQRVELQSQYTEVERLATDPTAVTDAQPLFVDPVTRRTAERYLSTRQNVRTLEQRYGTRHPEYLAANAALAEAQEAYIEQLRRSVRGVATELEIAKRNEADLRRSVARAREQLQALDRAEFELSMLERDVDSNQRLYDVFLNRFNETETRSSFNETNARVADPAVPPKHPFKPDRGKAVAAALFVGMVLALLFVLIRELLRSRIEHPDEVEGMTTIPLVGVLPYCRHRLLQRSAPSFIARHAREPFADAVRSVKTAVRMLERRAGESDSGAFVLAVTSAEPAEGKTTLTAALGQTLASSGRVLLIDADMRRPSLAKHYKMPSQGGGPGLVGFLSHVDTSVDDVCVTELADGVHLIPAGRPPANPALLIESERFRELIAWARQHYDYVLLDTPPVLATSDVLHVSPLVHGYLLVTRAEKTPRAAFLGMLKKLETVDAKGVGVVMNGAAAKRRRYGSDYYYGSSTAY